MPVPVTSPITSHARDPGLPVSPGAQSMPGTRDSVPEQAHGEKPAPSLEPVGNKP
jgi:hypothetical protein